MNHITKYFLPLLSLLALFSCQNARLGIDPNTQAMVLSDSAGWRVTYFYDNDKEETSDYQGDQLFFDADGSFRVIRSDASSYAGSWSLTNDDGLPRLVLNISGNKDLEELSDDWVIRVFEETKIELSDDNSSKTEELKLERN